jgi:phospholipase/carboxylesterase
MVPPRSGGIPQQVVVLLHGYGSDGADLISLAPVWQPILPEALFVSPNAPEMCRQLSFGFQWFDISFEGDRLAKRQVGVETARPVLVEFLEDLWNQTGVAPEQTVLAGFSQGAMMALHVGLSLEQRLMGIIAFSGAFLPPQGFGSPSLAKPPVCIVHGDMDDVVDPELSADADVALRLAGFDVSYHVSQGTAHGIAPDGLDYASQFLRKLTSK